MNTPDKIQSEAKTMGNDKTGRVMVAGETAKETMERLDREEVAAARKAEVQPGSHSHLGTKIGGVFQPRKTNS